MKLTALYCKSLLTIQKEYKNPKGLLFKLQAVKTEALLELTPTAC